MPFRDLGFLPKAEAMEIEGGKRVLGYAPTLEVAQRLGETFDNAHNKHQCGDQTTCEKANATEPSPTRITPSQRHVVDSRLTQFLGPALKRKLFDP